MDLPTPGPPIKTGLETLSFGEWWMPANNNTRHTVLSTLAGSGNQLVQLGTLGLVAISGLTSFFQTQEVGHEGRVDRDRAIKEIHQLYDRVDGFEQRQKQILQNQTQMLQNQENVLRIMSDNQKNYLRNLIPPKGP
jgi:hypothetical protein